MFTISYRNFRFNSIITIKMDCNGFHLFCPSCSIFHLFLQIQVYFKARAFKFFKPYSCYTEAFIFTKFLKRIIRKINVINSFEVLRKEEIWKISLFLQNMDAWAMLKQRSKTSACTGKNPETNCLIFVIMLTTFFALSPEVS